MNRGAHARVLISLSRGWQLPAHFEGTSVSQHLDKIEKIFKEFVVVRVKMTDRD
jgi:hypothetical protein